MLIGAAKSSSGSSTSPIASPVLRRGSSSASLDLLHEDQRVGGAGDGSLHEQQVALGVRTDDPQLLTVARASPRWPAMRMPL